MNILWHPVSENPSVIPYSQGFIILFLYFPPFNAADYSSFMNSGVE